MTGEQINGIITIAIGIFFTLAGFEVVSLGKKPPDWDPPRLDRWEKTQKLYRYGGPIIIAGGIAAILIG